MTTRPEPIEERVALLETEVKQLKNKVENNLAAKPWWEQIVGTFAGDSAYDEAMQLGSEYRDSLSPESEEAIDE